MRLPYRISNESDNAQIIEYLSNKTADELKSDRNYDNYQSFASDCTFYA